MDVSCSTTFYGCVHSNQHNIQSEWEDVIERVYRFFFSFFVDDGREPEDSTIRLGVFFQVLL
jgi:hypothetical protein